MARPLDIVIGAAVDFFLVAVAAGILYQVWGRYLPTPKRLRVLAFQQGVLLRGGEVEKVLAPGDYWVTTGRTLLLCDMRPKPFQVPAQELFTADGMGLRVSVGGEYRVVDPALFLMGNTDAFGAFYLEIRQALRVAASEFNAENVLSERSLLTARVKELLIPRAVQLGLELSLLDVWEIVLMGWTKQV